MIVMNREIGQLKPAIRSTNYYYQDTDIFRSLNYAELKFYNDVIRCKLEEPSSLDQTGFTERRILSGSDCVILV